MSDTAVKTKGKRTKDEPRRGRPANAWSVVTMDEIGRHIAAKAMSQVEFATMLGVTNSTFHNWKKGRCAPDTDTQRRISALLQGKPMPQDDTPEAIPKSKHSRRRAPAEVVESAKGKIEDHRAEVAEQRAKIVQQGMSQIDSVGEALSAAKVKLAEVRASLKSAAKLK